MTTNSTPWTWLVAHLPSMGDALFQVHADIAHKLPGSFLARRVTRIIPQPQEGGGASVALVKWFGSACEVAGETVTMQRSALDFWAPAEPERTAIAERLWEPRLVEPAPPGMRVVP